MKVQWTNKYSKEQGYVKALNKKEGYFENTFDKAEAKDFTAKQLSSVMEFLSTSTPDNDYKAFQEVKETTIHPAKEPHIRKAHMRRLPKDEVIEAAKTVKVRATKITPER
jgi:hypothetical protein